MKTSNTYKKDTSKDLWGWVHLETIDLMTIWKTPTKYCLSLSYLRYCEFFGTLEEARKRAFELLKQFNPEYLK